MNFFPFIRGKSRAGAPRGAQSSSPSHPAVIRRNLSPGRIVLGVAIAMLGMTRADANAGDSDFGTWQWLSLEVYHQDKFTATLFNETRWRDNSTDFSLELVGPLFRYQAWSHTSFALGAYYLHVPRGFNLDDTNQAWLDVEMLNTWKPSADFAISARTMFENRWLEDPHGMRQVSRHRFGVAYTCKNMGPLARLYANDEVFLDWDSSEIRENRAIPIAAAFKLKDNLNLDLFPMIRSTKGKEDWTNEFILGSHLVWKL